MAPLDVAPVGVVLVDTPTAALTPVAVVTGPAAGPDDATPNFDISLAPTDAIAPTVLEPISVPPLITDVDTPVPAAAPVDAGTGLDTGLDVPEEPSLDDTVPQEQATVDDEANSGEALSTVLSTMAAIAAAACLVA